MEILLAAVLSTTVLLGAGQTLQHFLARHIQKLALEGSKFHLAQASSGAVELRSGVRQGSLTQREAAALAPALRTLVSRVRWNPIIGLKLLSKNQGLVDAQEIEDVFLKAAVDSQRRELILLAEDRGVKGRAVDLIMGVERDEDFEKLRKAIHAADYGEDLPEALAKKLQLRDRRAVEPLVLWSSKPSPKAIAASRVEGRQLDTGTPGVVEETIPDLPGYSLRTWIDDRGKSYEKIIVEIRHSGQIVASEGGYMSVYRNRLDQYVASTKRNLINQIKALSAMGI